MNEEFWKVAARMADGSISQYEAIKSEYPTWEDAMNVVLAQPNVKSAVVRIK